MERPELRRDALSGRLVTVAPARGRRPGAPAGGSLEADDPSSCPFCEGHEAETPPEVLAVRPGGGPADSPGWRARVVPNLYPAFVDEPAVAVGAPPLAAERAVGRQEVVVHSPRHVSSLAELDEAELTGIAAVWRARAEAARAAGFAYLHVLVNEGRAAGASRSHTHSQLVALPAQPPVAIAEQTGGAACALCALLAAETAGGERLVAHQGGLVLLCPFAGRAPYELLAAPVDCEDDAFASERLGAALVLVAEGIRALRAEVGPVALNLWLHSGPLGKGTAHWHIEVLPRLTVFAGLELGAGIYVNALPPEEAAPGLRAQLAAGSGPPPVG